MKTFYRLLTSFALVSLLFGFAAFSADALTVTPAKFELQSDPGQTLTGVVKLFNETDATKTFYTSSENFEPSGDTGKPKFIGAESGLATWTSMKDTVTVPSKKTIEVPFEITIPSDVDPGGYFSALFFGTQPPANEGGKVSIGGRLGILLLLRVNGDIPEEGGVLEYKKTTGSFYDVPPVEIEYLFSNNGGDRVVPRGDIQIKNTFGSVRATINANETEGSVLPSSTRRFTQQWGYEDETPSGFFQKAAYQLKHFHFGWYKAEMNLGWGFTNQTSNDKTSFMIVPWQLLILVIVGLVVVKFILRFAAAQQRKSIIKELEKEKEPEENEES